MGRLARIGPRAGAALSIAAGAILALTAIHRGTIDSAAIRDAIQHNPLAPLIFVAFQILASLFFVPRTILGIAAGLLFGLAWGSFWAILGAEAGAAAGFAVARWIGAGDVNLEEMPRLGPLLERAERGGWRAVAIVRLVPGLPHSVVNTALALTRISWVDYLLGSFAGMLPMTVFQVDIGAAGGFALGGGRGWIIATMLGVLGIAASYALKRVFSSRT